MPFLLVLCIISACAQCVACMLANDAYRVEMHNTGICNISNSSELLYLLNVLYIQHFHQSVDCKSLQDGIDGGRAHISADVLLEAQDPSLSLKLMAVAAYHVHKPPEGCCLHEKGGGALMAGTSMEASEWKTC